MEKTNQDIRDLIEQRCLTHKEVAEYIGMSNTSFSRMMRNPINPKKKEKIINSIVKLDSEKCKLTPNFDNKMCGNCKHNLNGKCKYTFQDVKSRNICSKYRYNNLCDISEYILVTYIDKFGNQRVALTSILDFVANHEYVESISKDNTEYMISKVEDLIDEDEHHFLILGEIEEQYGT